MEQRKEEPEKTPESHPADIFTGKIDYPGSKEQKAVSSMEAELPPFEADGENPEEDRISFVAPKNTSTLNEMDVLEESGENYRIDKEPVHLRKIRSKHRNYGRRACIRIGVRIWTQA